MRAADLQNSPAAEFRYVLHVRRQVDDRPGRPTGQLLATDGTRVRSIRSRGDFVTYREFECFELSREIVDLIQREWQPRAPFIGYGTLTDASVVAILHGGDDARGRNWAAFPCRRDVSTLLALRDTEGLSDRTGSMHLVGGAELRWRHGAPYVETALEFRDHGLLSQQAKGALADHIESLELRATARQSGEEREIALVARSDRDQTPVRTSTTRLEAEFPLDTFVFRQFSDHPSFQPRFHVQFDEASLGVPPIWRRFSMTVDLERV